MRWTDVVLILGGLAIGFFGWILLAGGILTLGETEEKVGMVGHVVLTIMLGLVPAVLGMWMIWIPFRNRRRRKKEQLERTILRLAADSDGVLTQAHVARSTELTLDEAKTVSGRAPAQRPLCFGHDRRRSDHLPLWGCRLGRAGRGLGPQVKGPPESPLEVPPSLGGSSGQPARTWDFVIMDSSSGCCVGIHTLIIRAV